MDGMLCAGHECVLFVFRIVQAIGVLPIPICADQLSGNETLKMHIQLHTDPVVFLQNTHYHFPINDLNAQNCLIWLMH